MGASEFMHISKGRSAKEAFNNAVLEASYEYGHGGYTGTVAEKDSFIMITCPGGKDPYDYAQELIMKDDSRISDKWGPAGCIKMETEKMEEVIEETLPPNRVKKNENIFKGTRKWKTVYTIYEADTSAALSEEETKGAAIKRASELALSKRKPMHIRLEKKLVNSDPHIASIEPIIKKVNKKLETEINTYLFFGWASD